MSISRHLKRVISTAGFTLFVGLAVLLTLHNTIVGLYNQQVKIHYKDQMESISTRLLAALETRFSIVDAVGAIMETFPATSEDEFNYIARELMANNRPIRAIQFADTSTSVIYNYPYKTNEITTKKPIRLLDDPVRRPWVVQTMNTARKSIQTPFELRQGGVGTVVRKALYAKGTFVGLSIGVFNLAEILEEVLKTANTSDSIQLCLSDTAGVVFYEDSLFNKSNSTQNTLSLTDTEWLIEASGLQSGVIPPTNTIVLLWILGSLFLLTLLLLEVNVLTKNEKLESELKRQEQILLANNKRYLENENLRTTGQLAGGIAHNFNNHLAIIQGNAEIMQLNPSLAQKSSEIIIDQCIKSSKIVSQLLFLARKTLPMSKTFDLSALISDFIESFEIVSNKDIDIILNIQKENVPIRGDQEQVQILLNNILTNSCESIESKGIITISAENTVLTNLSNLYAKYSLKNDYFMKITITDTGKGIADEHIEKIFEPFYTTKTFSEGKGLGLSAAYGIILNHSGAIDVTSKKGEGTTVEFYLPIAYKINN